MYSMFSVGHFFVILSALGGCVATSHSSEDQERFPVRLRGGKFELHSADEAATEGAKSLTRSAGKGSPVHTLATDGSCASDWTKRGIYCYKRGSDKLNFDDAKALCAGDDSWLADIFGAVDNEFVRTTFVDTSSGYFDVLLGLNDLAVEGTFVNDRNPSIPACYFNWRNGDPNNANGNENCVHIRWGDFGRWGDRPCGTAFAYPLCKKLADSVPSSREVLDCSIPDANFPPAPPQISTAPTEGPTPVPSAEPTADPSAQPSAEPSAQPSFSELVLAAIPPAESPITVSVIPKAKPYSYVVRFGQPIIQYRPNGSVSAAIGVATAGDYIGNNQYLITGGDGPCKKAGDKNRDGVLTLQCAATQAVVVDEVSVCTFEITWSGPSFC